MSTTLYFEQCATKCKDSDTSIELKCEKCTYWTHKWSRLNRHIQVVHENLRKCSMCHFLTERKQDLKNHQNVEHKSEMIFCTQCSYSTHKHRQTDLKIHIKLRHEKVFDVFCDQCDSSFSSEKNLRQHQRRVHGQSIKSQKLTSFSTNALKCTECLYLAPQSSSLKTHMLKTHQLAVCMNCSYKGLDFEELRKHCLEFS